MDENINLNYSIIAKDIINSYYDIGDFQEILEILKEKNKGNLVLKIKTSRGIFVLKSYHRKFMASRLMKNLNLVKELMKEIPFPLILTKSNMTYTIYNYEIYTLDRFIDGEHLNDDWSEEKMINSAKLLASLHKKTSHIREDEKTHIRRVNHFGLIDRLWIKSSLCNHDQGYVGLIEEKEKKTDFDNFILSEVNPELKRQIPILKKELEIINKIERKTFSYNHGDFHSLNIIFSGFDVAALIDYELMEAEYNGLELIKGMSAIVKFDEKKGYDLKLLKLFIKSYEEVYGAFDIQPQEAITYLRHSLVELSALFIGGYVQIDMGEESKELPIIYKKLLWLNSNDKKIKRLFKKPFFKLSFKK